MQGTTFDTKPPIQRMYISSTVPLAQLAVNMGRSGDDFAPTPQPVDDIFCLTHAKPFKRLGADCPAETESRIRTGQCYYVKIPVTTSHSPGHSRGHVGTARTRKQLVRMRPVYVYSTFSLLKQVSIALNFLGRRALVLDNTSDC
jgi:hypothetical protein